MYLSSVYCKKLTLLKKRNIIFNLNRDRERERERERERLCLKIYHHDTVEQDHYSVITASYIKRKSRTLRPKTCTGLTISGARQLS